MCIAQLQYEHRGQLFSLSAFRQTAEICQVATLQNVKAQTLGCFYRVIITQQVCVECDH